MGGGVIGVTRYLVVLATLNVMVEGWWLPTDSFLFLPPLFIILWGHVVYELLALYYCFFRVSYLQSPQLYYILLD